MAVNMKLGVDLGSFNTGINQAKAQIKTFDAALKQAESQFKATGDAESAMTTKMSALTSKLSTQKKVVEDYRRALETMTKNNVDPLSTAFQKMQKEMLLAESAMYDTQTALNELSSSEQKAAQGADALTNSVNSIGKKISLDQVINGIGRITDGLENAGEKALQLGEQIFSAVMDKARWADDSQTMALMYGIPLERFLKMQKLVQNGLDTSVDAVLGAQSKLAKGIGGESTAAMQALKDLGVSLKTLEDTGDGILEFVDKDPEETFFEIGRALMAMEKAYDKEAAAQALFGRSWKELVPLFDKYKTLEEYNAALEDTKTASEEDVNALAELNDKVDKLKGNLDTLSTDILATLAPALSEGADALNGMLESLLKYLETPEGQQMLTDLGEAISGLFEDLGKIDPEQTVQNFTKVFTDITTGVQWIANHSGEVVAGLEAIVIGWGALKLTGGALDILKLVQGLQGLGAGGGIGGAAGQVMLNLGGKLAFNGIEDTLGTKIGSVIANGLTSTPMTVMIAAASIAALGHAIYTVINEGDPLEKFLTSSGMEEDRAKEVAEDMRKGYNPFDTEANARVTRGIKSFLTTGKWESEPVEIPTEPEVPENAAENIEEQIGAVTVPVNLRVNMGGGAFGGGGGGIMDQMADALFASFRPGYANGIPFVPDTRLAWLHRGETVTPAREVTSRNYSSNLYVERMIMNNGTDANGLADAMAAAQRRTMSGYGS